MHGGFACYDAPSTDSRSTASRLLFSVHASVCCDGKFCPRTHRRFPREKRIIPMTSFTRFLAAAAAIGGVSAPLAAQNPYPYPQQGYPQQVYPYPNQQYGYGQQGYGNPVTDIIDSLLGNRYNISDRRRSVSAPTRPAPRPPVSMAATVTITATITATATATPRALRRRRCASRPSPTSSAARAGSASRD